MTNNTPNKTTCTLNKQTYHSNGCAAMPAQDHHTPPGEAPKQVHSPQPIGGVQPAGRNTKQETPDPQASANSDHDPEPQDCHESDGTRPEGAQQPGKQTQTEAAEPTSDKTSCCAR